MTERLCLLLTTCNSIARTYLIQPLLISAGFPGNKCRCHPLIVIVSREKTFTDFAVFDYLRLSQIVKNHKIHKNSFTLYDILSIRHRGYHFFATHFYAVTHSFLREIWGHSICWRSKREQSAKVFSAKIGVFFSNSLKFSLSKVSRYTVRYTQNH